MMKSKIISKITLALCLMGSTYSFGQNQYYQDRGGLGLKVGTNLSNVWDSRDQDFEADAKFGWAAGGFVHIPLGQYVGVQPEFMFSQKGFIGSGSFLGQYYEYEYTSNYVEIPLLLSINPSNRFSILVGPQYSYLTSEKREFRSGSGSATDFDDNEPDNIYRNRMGLQVGFDFRIQNNFVISPRASWDLRENHGDGTSSTPRYKNRLYQLTIGYMF
jgi:hypothetical protein